MPSAAGGSAARTKHSRDPLVQPILRTAADNATDLPDGQFCEIGVQPSNEKYFACPVGQISGTESGRLASIRGTYASSRMLRWDAVDAKVLRDERHYRGRQNRAENAGLPGARVRRASLASAASTQMKIQSWCENAQGCSLWTSRSHQAQIRAANKIRPTPKQKCEPMPVTKIGAAKGNEREHHSAYLGG
jgi:hypothetical protein